MNRRNLLRIALITPVIGKFITSDAAPAAASTALAPSTPVPNGVSGLTSGLPGTPSPLTTILDAYEEGYRVATGSFWRRLVPPGATDIELRWRSQNTVYTRWICPPPVSRL